MTHPIDYYDLVDVRVPLPGSPSTYIFVTDVINPEGVGLFIITEDKKLVRGSTGEALQFNGAFNFYALGETDSEGEPFQYRAVFTQGTLTKIGRY